MNNIPSILALLPLFLFPFGDLLSGYIPGNMSLSFLVGFTIIFLNQPIKTVAYSFFSLIIYFASFPFHDGQLVVTTPVYRLLISSVFWAPFFIAAFSPLRLNVKITSWRNFASFNSILAFLISLISICYYLQTNDRPEFPFTEASYLSLFLIYSSSVDFFSRSTSNQKFSIAINILAVILTRSTHILSFAFAFVLFHSTSILSRFVQIFRGSIKSSSLSKLLLIFVVLFLAFTVFFQNSQLNGRFFSMLDLLSGMGSDINIDNRDGSIISSISYHNGLMQALHVISHSPLFGAGPGAAGYNNFSPQLLGAKHLNQYLYLNYNDAYSLLFRGVIEFGFVFLFSTFFFLYRLLGSLSGDLNNSIIFLSLLLFVGSLFKQPVLPSNLVFLSFYISFIRLVP